MSEALSPQVLCGDLRIVCLKARRVVPPMWSPVRRSHAQLRCHRCGPRAAWEHHRWGLHVHCDRYSLTHSLWSGLEACHVMLLINMQRSPLAIGACRTWLPPDAGGGVRHTWAT